MLEDKNIDTPSENATLEDNITQKPYSGSSIFERRFIIYDKMKLSLKTVDFIIIFCVILLFGFFIVGAYLK